MGLVQITAIAFSIAIFLIVIDLIRRKLLKERYSLIWLAASVVFVVLSVWKSLLDLAARIIGIYYPPSLLFLVAIGFLIILLLHFSTVISSLSEKNDRLTQEMGILKAMLEGMKDRDKSKRSDEMKSP